MSAPEYPIGTLAEIAAIPDEALPRFLAELPEIIRYYRQAPAMFEALGELTGVKVIPQAPTWIDDDLRQRHVSLRAPDGDVLFRASSPIGGDA